MEGVSSAFLPLSFCLLPWNQIRLDNTCPDKYLFADDQVAAPAATEGEAVRFAAAGGLPEPLADVRPAPRVRGRIVRQAQPDRPAVQRAPPSEGRPPPAGADARSG